jgi:hypothetical protein
MPLLKNGSVKQTTVQLPPDGREVAFDEHGVSEEVSEEEAIAVADIPGYYLYEPADALPPVATNTPAASAGAAAGATTPRPRQQPEKQTPPAAAASTTPSSESENPQSQQPEGTNANGNPGA